MSSIISTWFSRMTANEDGGSPAGRLPPSISAIARVPVRRLEHVDGDGLLAVQNNTQSCVEEHAGEGAARPARRR